MKPQETTDAPAIPAEPDLLEIAVAPPDRIDGIVVGRVVAVGDGEIRVAFPGSRSGHEGAPARSLTPLSPADHDAEVALMFELGDPARPVILGKMATGLAGARPAGLVEARRDGERLVLGAEQEIVLTCGDASITLTREGKILLRGAYVSSRAVGVNRIQGGSVEIN